VRVAFFWTKKTFSAAVIQHWEREDRESERESERERERARESKGHLEERPWPGKSGGALSM